MTSCAHRVLLFSHAKQNAFCIYRLLAAAKVGWLLIASTVEHHEHEHVPLA